MEQLSLVEIVRAALPAVESDVWELVDGVFWCRADRPRDEKRIQGWKLHVSATVLSAPQVLHRAAVVLGDGGCAFKFARSLELVAKLTSTRYDRAQAGKFITVYPRDDEHFRALAEALDQATFGLPGPRILSDRPYREHSLVHYRYGAFHGVRTLTNDGSYEARIEAPDGAVVADRRRPWYSAPSWAVEPVDQPAQKKKVPATQVLLNGRFSVKSAIRHSARGGVYTGVDHETGSDVIIKQARAHIDMLPSGVDSRASLRNEHARLVELDGLAATPVALFDQDAYTFLVEAEVPGQSLGEWVRAKFVDLGADQGPGTAETLEVARKLVDLLDRVHERGLVYRDFTPLNIMVTPDDELVLIDPELTVRPGDPVTTSYTDGHAAPEVVAAPRYRRAPEQSSDLYALGSVLFYLVVGCPPVLLADDDPAARSNQRRIAGMLALATATSAAARRLEPLILGLMADDPADRWSLARARRFLTEHHAPPPAAVPAEDRAARFDALIADGLDHIVATMRPDADRLWDTDDFGAGTDECTVQYGAGGVLAVLTRADAVFDRPSLRDAVAVVARWIDARLDRAPRVLPGLQFGRAGTAWALHDAGRHLGDDHLVDRAIELALRLPTRWPNPDVCHGAAGAGFSQLHLWQATKDATFLARVNDCADGLLAAARQTDDGVFWPVPADFDSSLAGATHFGFAHGVAGVGAFLLAAADATGRADCLAMATAAGDTLVRWADRDKAAGSACWRTDLVAADDQGGLRYYWCNGASGVGTFLIRLAEHGATYRTLAEEAAVAAHQARRFSPPSVCHGLSGNGEYLLDLADASPCSQADALRYRGWAGDMADWLYARHGLRDGRKVIPDESGAKISVGYNTGLSGDVGFLIRLRHGGPRLWMVS